MGRAGSASQARIALTPLCDMDAHALGASLNLNMKCWETLLPHVVRHPLLRVDLMPLLKAYQRQYPGAMYSGCGGGYLIVVSKEPVPGAFKVNVRVASKMSSAKSKSLSPADLTTSNRATCDFLKKPPSSANSPCCFGRMQRWKKSPAKPRNFRWPNESIF